MRTAPQDVGKFINTVGVAAQEAMLKTGIPASFLIAYVAIASHFGNNKLHNPLASPMDRFPERQFGGYHNRWTFMLDLAHWLRQLSGMRGDCTAASLLQAPNKRVTSLVTAITRQRFRF